jgi:uracil-DNA glycosylase family 4
MGFFHLRKVTTKKASGMPSLELLHEKQCEICPLKASWDDLAHPHMPAYGDKDPIIYILGEAPGKTDDARGRPFVGNAGQLLREYIPKEWLPKLRWNNTIRTRPPGNRDPHPVEIECCRPSIVKDIERSKPEAIFAFGAVALKWALGNDVKGGAGAWTGRRAPVKIGNHTCWLYPFYHPLYILHLGEFQRRDMEFVFKKHLERAFDEVYDGLPDPHVHTSAVASENISIVIGGSGEEDRIVEFLREAVGYPVNSVDYETDRIRPFNSDAKILSIAVATPNHAMAWAVDHPGATWTDDQKTVLRKAWIWYLQQPVKKVAHNSAFEIEWSCVKYTRLAAWRGHWEDSMAQAFILDERQGALSLNFITMQNFGFDLKELSALDRSRLERAPVGEVLMYNGMDAKYHLANYFVQYERLKAERLLTVYRHHMERIPACVLTQIKGIPVDQEISGKFRRRFTSRLNKIEAKLDALPIVQKFKQRKGYDFRPSANKDIMFILRMMGVHPDSVDEAALKPIKHPIVPLILNWREANKLLSTYVLPLQPDTEKSKLYEDGLLHPILNTMKTDTWRTSAEDVNNQNYPKRENKEIRSQIKHRNRKIVAFDYAGIQARNIAMESKDPALVKAFWERYNIHADWRDKILRAYPRWIPRDELRDEERMGYWRNRAKNGFVFPSFFGAMPKKCAHELEIPEEIAKRLQRDLWRQFSSIKRWQDSKKREYNEQGYVSGLSGFRRRAPLSPNQLINSPIQADESKIVLTAMANLSKREDERFQPNMEIHDDLTFIWEACDIEKNAEIVITTMLTMPYDWINVPLGVEMSIGDDWANLKAREPIGEFYSDKWKGRL